MISKNNDTSILDIDGSILEAGGQLIRNTIAYSVITNQSIKINNIRQGRTKPGLRQQHLECVMMAKEICNATISNNDLYSKELLFIPDKINYDFKYCFNSMSRGSASLILQCITPILLFSNIHLNELTIYGGTNVSFSPPIDFIKHVLFTTLQLFGINASVIIKNRGYLSGKYGATILNIVPLNSESQLKPIDITSKGTLLDLPTCYIHGYCEKNYLDDIITEISNLIKCNFDTTEVDIISTENSKNQIIGFSLIAKTTTNCYINGSAVLYINIKKNYKNLLKSIVNYGVNQYNKQLNDSDLCVDEYLQDQLIIFMALTKGISKIKTGKITLHTKTSIYFSELMTNARFTIENIDDNHNIIICTSNYIHKNKI